MEHISTLHTFKRHARPILAGLTLGLCLIWVQSALAGPNQAFEKEAKTCDRAIQAHERRLKIPTGLLSAISRAESGRWNGSDAAIVAWPWTVTTGGKGHFLPNRADAVAFVKSLQADGVENIDIGCMQINLKYHPDAFVSIEHGFDPHANAAYAAEFLSERFQVSKSWIRAAGDYHSTTPDLNQAYRQKVTRLWKDTARPAPKLVAGTPTYLVPLDMDRTKSLNLAFRARGAQGGIARPGQAIANRVNALKPGAHLGPNSGLPSADSFAAKRQSQIMAWRQSNGLAPLLTTAPAPIQ